MSVITPFVVPFSRNTCTNNGDTLRIQHLSFHTTDCRTDCTEVTSACIGATVPATKAETIMAEKRTLCDEFFRKPFFIRLNFKLTFLLLIIILYTLFHIVAYFLAADEQMVLYRTNRKIQLAAISADVFPSKRFII